MPYFDANATTPLAPTARDAWLEVSEEDWANPSSPTRAAARARVRLEDNRQAWAAAFAVRPEQVVFTAGATEANNAVFAHLAQQAGAGARVLLSAVEHPCVLEPAEHWFPGRIERLAVDRGGRLDLNALRARLAAGPCAAVAVMAANNETGVLQPVAEVAEACRGHGAAFVCDAAQWAGKLPLDGLPRADYLTLSGHKFGGPRGVGVLVLGEAAAGFRGRRGGPQEHDHHAGTEDLAGIAALTAAFRAQPPEGWPSAGRDAFVASLAETAYEALGAVHPRLPNTVSLLLPRHRASRWIARLDRRGWAVSSGSACSTGKEGPSHVLAAMGLEAEAAHRVLRLSSLPEASVDDWLGLRAALDAVLRELDEDEGKERLTTVVEIDL